MASWTLASWWLPNVSFLPGPLPWIPDSYFQTLTQPLHVAMVAALQWVLLTRLSYISKAPLSVIFPDRLGYRRDSWKILEGGRKATTPTIPSSQGLLLTYWLSFWYETAVRPATVLPSSGPSFGFSRSWVRCLFSFVTKGPSFCRMPTLEDTYSSASTSLVKLWKTQMSKRCLRYHVAQAELFHDLSP